MYVWTSIDSVRTRLAEVQDRLIQIDLRRRDLAYLNFEGKDEVDPNDRDTLLEEDTVLDIEQGELGKEEEFLRLVLKDAGVPSPTVEDHAREKLSAIRSRLAEIAADPKHDTKVEMIRDSSCLPYKEFFLELYLSRHQALDK